MASSKQKPDVARRSLVDRFLSVIERIGNTLRRLDHSPAAEGPGDLEPAHIEEFRRDFRSALGDDLNTARAAFAEAKRLFAGIAGKLAAAGDAEAQTRTASNSATPSAVSGGANR